MGFRAAATASLALCLCALRIAQGTDYNGDGKQDLVWRNHAGNAIVWQMDGLSVGSRATLTPALDSGSAIVGSGDFFDSGPGAILWVDSTDRLSLWRIDGGSVLDSCVVASSIDPGWNFLGVGDLNADGRDDVAWRAPDGSVNVFLMNGCTIQQTITLAATADADWVFLGIGKVDSTSTGALFWRAANGDVVLWRVHNGNRIWATTLKGGIYASWTVAAVADFDGDGWTDLLFRDGDGANTALWRRDGNKYTPAAIVPASSDVFAAADTVFDGGFDRASQPALPLSPAWTIIGASDVDGDGRADAVLADTSGRVAVWQMNGAAIEASALFPAAGDMPYTALTGWRMRMDRPTVTMVDGQVTVAWAPVSGAPLYTAYASATNSPAATGVPITATGTTLSFGRNDAGYSDKRYFAISAHYLGVQLPPSPEAYITEFAATRLQDWGALAVADINADGCIDLVGAYGDCDGHFQPFSTAGIGMAALMAPGRSYRDLRFADFNGDGVLDAVADTYACDVDECGGNDTNSEILLFFGNGDGTFTEDAAFRNLNVPGGGYDETIVVADFNNDGHLDIFIPKYTFYDPSEHGFFLLNDGAGNFTDVADAAGVGLRDIPSCARPEGAEAADINGDGRIDLYAASHLFLNQGNSPDGVPLFSDLGAVVDDHCNEIAPSPAGLPVFLDEGAKFIDFDNSGQLSLAINGGSSAEGIRVLRFDGVAHFENLDVMPAMFFYDAWGFNAVDVDGDGLTDLVVAGGCDAAFFNGGAIDPSCLTFGNPHALPQLLVNRSGHFVLHDFYDDGLQPTERGWHDLITYADFDYSGTPDFVSRATGGTDTGLYSIMNLASNPDVLTVTVTGPDGERNQAGRVVHARPVLRPGITMTQVVDGGAGYMSNGPYDVTFAAPYPGAYAVSVRFAGGTYTATAHAGDHLTMRADGTYSLN